VHLQLTAKLVAAWCEDSFSGALKFPALLPTPQISADELSKGNTLFILRFA
jgi:hypothetical protein